MDRSLNPGLDLIGANRETGKSRIRVEVNTRTSASKDSGQVR